jgi:hypothetical protein
MLFLQRAQARSIVTGSVLVLAAMLAPPMLSPAAAQGGGQMEGVGETDTVSIRASVKAVDQTARTVTLVGPHGETRTVKVGPEVKNLAQVKAGDIVIAAYRESVAYVVAPPGTQIPADSLTAVGVRTLPGEKPAAFVAEKLVVTGLVVGVNVGASTLSVVDPQGGQVRTLTVKDPQYRSMLPSIKVGDTITAVISEAAVVAVEPAT